MSLPLLHLPALCHVSWHCSIWGISCCLYACSMLISRNKHKRNTLRKWRSNCIGTSCSVTVSCSCASQDHWLSQPIASMKSLIKIHIFCWVYSYLRCHLSHIVIWDAQIKDAVYAAGSRGRPDATADLWQIQQDPCWHLWVVWHCLWQIWAHTHMATDRDWAGEHPLQHLSVQ